MVFLLNLNFPLLSEPDMRDGSSVAAQLSFVFGKVYISSWMEFSAKRPFLLAMVIEAL